MTAADRAYSDLSTDSNVSVARKLRRIKRRLLLETHNSIMNPTTKSTSTMPTTTERSDSDLSTSTEGSTSTDSNVSAFLKLRRIKRKLLFDFVASDDTNTNDDDASRNQPEDLCIVCSATRSIGCHWGGWSWCLSLNLWCTTPRGQKKAESDYLGHCQVVEDSEQIESQEGWFGIKPFLAESHQRRRYLEYSWKFSCSVLRYHENLKLTQFRGSDFRT